MPSFLALAAFLFVQLLAPWSSLRAQTPDVVPLGVWADEHGDSHVELYRCGDELCGKIVQLREPTGPDGKPRLDEHNPDPKLRTQPYLGLVMLRDLHYNAAEKRWDNGQIYDPNNGRTYSCYLRQLGPDRLEVKGYIGFPLVGRAQTWTRVR